MALERKREPSRATFFGERCWHCGEPLELAFIAGMWYPDAPYQCVNHGGGMERWEGIRPENVTDEDRGRWQKWKDSKNRENEVPDR